MQTARAAEHMPTSSTPLAGAEALQQPQVGQDRKHGSQILTDSMRQVLANYALARRLSLNP